MQIELLPKQNTEPSKISIVEDSFIESATEAYSV